MPKTGKKLDEQQLQQHMEAYAEASPDRLLEDVFGPYSGLRDSSCTTEYVDRADYIVINGRTVTDLLVEDFAKKMPTMTNPKTRNPFREDDRKSAFSLFYPKEAKQLINQMVSNAVANGDKVEVYMPDKPSGKIPKTPVTLTAVGKVPGKDLTKPAQLTRWQRFWSTFGFYRKEKAAAQSAMQDYEKEAALRSRIQFSNRVARSNLMTNFANGSSYLEALNKYQPEVVEDMKKYFPHSKGNPEHLGESNGFKTKRSSFNSLAVCVLATKRDKTTQKLLYTNEELFDFTGEKMCKARAEAMKEVYEAYKKGDTNWLIDLQHDACKVITDRADEMATKLDFGRTDLVDQKGYREFALLCDTAFDQSQDMTSSQDAMDKKYGAGTYWADTGKIGGFSQIARIVSKSMNAKQNLLNGYVGNDLSSVCGEIKTVMQTESMLQHINKGLKGNPPQKLMNVATGNLMIQCANFGAFDDVDPDDVEVLKNGGKLPPTKQMLATLGSDYLKNRQAGDRQIRTGVLEKRIRLESFTAKPAAGEDAFKLKLNDVKTAERMVERQKQQPQKTADEAKPVL